MIKIECKEIEVRIKEVKELAKWLIEEQNKLVDKLDSMDWLVKPERTILKPVKRVKTSRGGWKRSGWTRRKMSKVAKAYWANLSADERAARLMKMKAARRMRKQIQEQR
jgi:hypothetical protein